MNSSKDAAVYRLRKHYRKDEASGKKYQGSFQIIDNRTEEVMAACDLFGRAAFSTLAITDCRQQTWEMTPNRRIMPSRWIVTDPGRRVAMQFDQKIMGKLVNPLYKVVLALLDGEGREVYRLVDPRTDIPDMIFGAGPGEWAVVSGDRPMAKVVRLPRKKSEDPSGGGLLRRLKGLLSTSDPGILSAGESHLLSAPVALGMLLLFQELTDTSGG